MAECCRLAPIAVRPRGTVSEAYKPCPYGAVPAIYQLLELEQRRQARRPAAILIMKDSLDPGLVKDIDFVLGNRIASTPKQLIQARDKHLEQRLRTRFRQAGEQDELRHGMSMEICRPPRHFQPWRHLRL